MSKHCGHKKKCKKGCCGSCGTKVEPAKAMISCEYCHTETFCNEGCRAAGWAHHAEACNAMLVTSPDRDLAFVPYGFENTANERARATQTEPLPNYLLQHREPNGTITQTVVPSIGLPLASASASGRQDAPARGTTEKIQPHNYTITVRAPGQEPLVIHQVSTEGLIHDHSASSVAVKLAKSRSPGSASGPVGAVAEEMYWSGPVASGPKGAFAVPLNPIGSSLVSVELKRERKNDSFRIEGSISSSICSQMERFRGALGTGMVAHLEQQLQSKGISSGRRGETLVLVGRDPATSAKAILTFSVPTAVQGQGQGQEAVATLLDVEVHVPKDKSKMAPLALQSEVFQLNPNPMSLVDVDAMCSALQERVHALEYHMEGIGAGIGAHVDDHAECKQHLDSLLEHKRSLEERGGPEKTQLPIGVRTAVTFATRNLYSVDGDIALIGERAERTDLFVRKLVEAKDDKIKLDEIEQLINAAGRDYVAWRKKLVAADQKHAQVTGRFKRAFSGALSIPNIKREIKLRKRELDDWARAIMLQKGNAESVLGYCSGRETGNPIRKYEVLLIAIQNYLEAKDFETKTASLGTNTKALLHDDSDTGSSDESDAPPPPPPYDPTP
jgi:hypothetical protein